MVEADTKSISQQIEKNNGDSDCEMIDESLEESQIPAQN